MMMWTSGTVLQTLPLSGHHQGETHLGRRGLGQRGWTSSCLFDGIPASVWSGLSAPKGAQESLPSHTCVPAPSPLRSPGLLPLLLLQLLLLRRCKFVTGTIRTPVADIPAPWGGHPSRELQDGYPTPGCGGGGARVWEGVKISP